MPGSAPLLKRRPEWTALAEHYAKIKDVHLRTLFAEDPRRGERLTAEGAGLYLDYSKHRITDETLRLLLALAGAVDLRGRIDAMFRGDTINVTEDRAVLHVALRAPSGQSTVVDGVNVVPQVHAVLNKMSAFAEQVRSGAWTGHTGKRIRNVINVGIGGSDLGPVMAYEALRHYSERTMTFRFVSNVDGTDFAEAHRLGQREEEPNRLVGDPVLRVVEVEAGPLRGEPLSPPRILGEERAEVHILDLGVVLGECRPLRAAREERRVARHD